MSISLHQASVGVFVPFLENLSDLLDRAAGYAQARGIHPSILLAMRLSPTMYDLAQQVGEANRHATVACATSCATRASILPRRIFWDLRELSNGELVLI